jgi:hypothetical protein
MTCQFESVFRVAAVVIRSLRTKKISFEFNYLGLGSKQSDKNGLAPVTCSNSFVSYFEYRINL